LFAASVGVWRVAVAALFWFESITLIRTTRHAIKPTVLRLTPQRDTDS
jgi:hypothetical protein